MSISQALDELESQNHVFTINWWGKHSQDLSLVIVLATVKDGEWTTLTRELLLSKESVTLKENWEMDILYEDIHVSTQNENWETTTRNGELFIVKKEVDVHQVLQIFGNIPWFNIPELSNFGINDTEPYLVWLYGTRLYTNTLQFDKEFRMVFHLIQEAIDMYWYLKTMYKVHGEPDNARYVHMSLGYAKRYITIRLWEIFNGTKKDKNNFSLQSIANKLCALDVEKYIPYNANARWSKSLHKGIANIKSLFIEADYITKKIGLKSMRNRELGHFDVRALYSKKDGREAIGNEEYTDEKLLQAMTKYPVLKHSEDIFGLSEIAKEIANNLCTILCNRTLNPIWIPKNPLKLKISVTRDIEGS